MNYAKEKNYTIRSLEKKKQKALIDKDFVIITEIDLKKKIYHGDILEEIRNIEGIHYVEELN
jgi:hypothetical protein